MNEVNEELDRVGDEVTISATLLLDDHLGVPNNETAEEKEASPKINLLIKIEVRCFKYCKYVIILTRLSKIMDMLHDCFSKIRQIFMLRKKLVITAKSYVFRIVLTRWIKLD